MLEHVTKLFIVNDNIELALSFLLSRRENGKHLGNILVEIRLYVEDYGLHKISGLLVCHVNLEYLLLKV